jgi:hypothetical protein
MGSPKRGTVPKEGTPNRHKPNPGGKRGERAKGNMGLPKRLGVGETHLPVPASRHTVMQSMNACLTLAT